MKKKLLAYRIGVIVLSLALVVAGVRYAVKAYYGVAPQIVVESGGTVNVAASQPATSQVVDTEPVIEPVDETVDETNEALGAVSGPVITNNSITIGGLTTYGKQVKFYPTATTTICAWKQPAATSTPTFAAVSLTTATSSAMVVSITTNNDTAFATSSGNRLGASLPIAANGRGSVIGSTTAAAVLIPNKYTVVGVAGYSNGFDVDGYCSFESKTIK